MPCDALSSFFVSYADFRVPTVLVTFQPYTYLFLAAAAAAVCAGVALETQTTCFSTAPEDLGGANVQLTRDQMFDFYCEAAKGMQWCLCGPDANESSVGSQTAACRGMPVTRIYPIPDGTVAYEGEFGYCGAPFASFKVDSIDVTCARHFNAVYLKPMYRGKPALAANTSQFPCRVAAPSQVVPIPRQTLANCGNFEWYMAPEGSSYSFCQDDGTPEHNHYRCDGGLSERCGLTDKSVRRQVQRLHDRLHVQQVCRRFGGADVVPMRLHAAGTVHELPVGLGELHPGLPGHPAAVQPGVRPRLRVQEAVDVAAVRLSGAVLDRRGRGPAGELGHRAGGAQNGAGPRDHGRRPGLRATSGLTSVSPLAAL
jgi:hypothetical protein